MTLGWLSMADPPCAHDTSGGATPESTPRQGARDVPARAADPRLAGRHPRHESRGIRVLHIPYQFAHGERGAGADIPPKCDLVFAIELKDVK